MKILLILFALVLFSSQVEAAEIMFKEKAYCGSDWIRITDIATIKGTEEEKKQLKDIFFGKGPTAGAPKELSNDYLKRRLKHFGFPNSKHLLTFPQSSVTVKKGNSKNRIEEITRECEYLLLAYFKEFSRIDVFLEDSEGQFDNLPKGLISVDMPAKTHLPKHSSEQALYLEVMAGEKKIKGYFRSKIKIYKKSYVSKRTIRGRAVIEERHLQLKDCEVLLDQSPGFQKKEDLLGQKVNITKIIGRRFVQGDLMPQLMVKKDQKIIIVKKGSVVTTTLWVTALSDGYKDQIITCKTTGGQFLRVKVIAKDKVDYVSKVSGKSVINVGGKK